MCTALTLKTKENEHLFGRNMDIEYSFNQSVGIVPRNFEYVNMATMKKEKTKKAIIGMITIMENHPMFADGMNENGLAIAGLNFPGYAKWEQELVENKINIPAYDLIFWVLSNFETLEEVKKEIINVNLTNTQINEKALPPVLHWIVTDRTGKSIVIEKTIEGLKVFENKIGVLTNSPTFDWHMTNLRQYIGMYPEQSKSAKWVEEDLLSLGQGVGSVGLPGDFTPASRFVRIAFLKAAIVENDSKEIDINEFFHLLSNVAMVRGSVRTPQNMSDITQYTACMNQEKGIYYYNNYRNNQIKAIDINKENLDAKEIKLFEYNEKLEVSFQN